MSKRTIYILIALAVVGLAIYLGSTSTNPGQQDAAAETSVPAVETSASATEAAPAAEPSAVENSAESSAHEAAAPAETSDTASAK